MPTVSADINALLLAATDAAARTELGVALFSDTVPDNAVGTNGDFAVVGPSGIIYRRGVSTWAIYSAAVTRITHAVTGTPTGVFGTVGDLALLYTGGVVTSLLEKTGVTTWTTLASFAGSGTQVSAVTSIPGGGTGNDGDLAFLYAGAIVTSMLKKTSGTWGVLASFPTTAKQAHEFGVVQLVDNFVGGNIDALTTDSIVGQLGWKFVEIDDGAAFRIGSIATEWFGCATLGPATGATNAAAICFDDDTSAGTHPFNVATITGMTNFAMRWRVKCSPTVNSVWMGFGSTPVAAGADAPTRFAGLYVDPAQANYRFRSHESATITDVDSGVAIDGNFHNFLMTWNGTQWMMSLDGLTPLAVTQRMTVASVNVIAWIRNEGGTSVKINPSFFSLYGEF